MAPDLRPAWLVGGFSAVWAREAENETGPSGSRDRSEMADAGQAYPEHALRPSDWFPRVAATTIRPLAGRANGAVASCR